MKATCSVCGRSYDVHREEEANNPNRECLSCHFNGFPWWIDNVYPESDGCSNAFLMWKPLESRPICVGVAEKLPSGEYAVDIDTPYDEESGSDSHHIGTYTRNEAIVVLWAYRKDAYTG